MEMDQQAGAADVDIDDEDDDDLEYDDDDDDDYLELYFRAFAWRDAETDTKPVDDPVIGEIPVYLSKALGKELFLLQFPSKTSDCDVLRDVFKGRIKPTSGIVELTAYLDTESEHYDEIFADNLPSQMDESKCEKTAENGSALNTFTLRGDRNVVEGGFSDYVIAAIEKDGMFLCPVPECIRLQPAFTYLDDNTRAKKGETDRNDEEEDLPVTVKFAHRSVLANERITRAEEIMKQMKREEQESWYHLQYHHVDSAASNAALNLLRDAPLNNVTGLWGLSKEDYMNELLRDIVWIKPFKETDELSDADEFYDTDDDSVASSVVELPEQESLRKRRSL